MMLKTDLLHPPLSLTTSLITEYPLTHQSLLIKMLSFYRKRNGPVTVVTATGSYPYQKGRKKYIFKIWTQKMEKNER